MIPGIVRAGSGRRHPGALAAIEGDVNLQRFAKKCAGPQFIEDVMSIERPVIAANAGMITPDFVKPGATVIDVGMNTVTDPEQFKEFFAGNEKRERDFAAKGSTLIGDVHPKVAEVAGAITPVPGGVGPLTIAMLMSNTVKAAKLRRGESC